MDSIKADVADMALAGVVVAFAEGIRHGDAEVEATRVSELEALIRVKHPSIVNGGKRDFRVKVSEIM